MDLFHAGLKLQKVYHKVPSSFGLPLFQQHLNGNDDISIDRNMIHNNKLIETSPKSEKREVQLGNDKC